MYLVIYDFPGYVSQQTNMKIFCLTQHQQVHQIHFLFSKQVFYCKSVL
jgi:hypothetical protein